MGRSTCQTRNSWIKLTKSHKIQQIARKKLGLFLVGIFELGQKATKLGWNMGVGTPRFESTMAHDTKMF